MRALAQAIRNCEPHSSVFCVGRWPKPIPIGSLPAESGTTYFGTFSIPPHSQLLAPAFHQIAINPQVIENPHDNEVHQILHRFVAVIETGRCRQHRGAGK